MTLLRNSATLIIPDKGGRPRDERVREAAIGLVRCTELACRGRSFCRHAVEHVERENCYNQNPRGRMNEYTNKIHCPACEVVR